MIRKRQQITATKATERHSNSQEWLNRVYREAPVGLCYLDTDLRFIFINEWLAAMNGIPVEEHLGRTIGELLPDVAAGVESQLRRVIETGQPIVNGMVKAETRAYLAEKRHFLHNYYAIKSDDGTVTGVSCVVQDITERRRAEGAVREAKNRLESMVEERTKQLSKANAQLRAEATVRARTEVALQKAHERLRLTVESSPDAMVIADHEGLVTLVNSQTEKLFGYAREALLGKSIEMLVPERLRSKHREHRSGYAANPCVRPMGIGLELFGCRKDGSEFPVEISLSPFETDEGQFVSSTFRDITDRKQVEQELHEKEMRFRAAATTASDLIYDYDVEKGIIHWFGDVDSHLGYEPGEFPHTLKAWEESLHPDDHDRITQAGEKALETWEDVHFSYRIRRKDGAYRHWEAWGKAIGFTGKIATRWVGACVDVTERKQAEERLRKNEERSRLLLESVDIIPWEADAESWFFTYVGPQAVKLLGYPLKQWYENDFWTAHIHPDDREWAVDFCRSFSQHEDKFEFDYRMIAADGRTVWLHDLVSVVRENGKPKLLRGFMVDISDRKRAQETLQELSARLIEAQEEERSRIARELHDDTSQKLALLAIELDQLGQHPPKSTAQLRERAQTLCRHTQDIASEIHNLSRQLHPSILDELGLVTAVRSYCGEISRQHGIQIIFNQDNVSSSISKPVSLCLYRIVQEAVQNVVKHSRAQEAKIELAQRSGMLHLRISDSGVGFDINSLQGQGGLGLVSMRERLRLVGGKLSIQSQPSQGTQIEVQLPISIPTD